MTGTPLHNNLGELWSLLNFLLPKVFHSSENFESWFKKPLLGKEEDQYGLSREEESLIIQRFHKVLRPFLLRRVKSDVESVLPKKVEFVVKLQLSDWQRLIYKSIKDKSNRAKKFHQSFNNPLMQLRKACNHPFLFEDEYPVSELIMRSSGKFEFLDRVIPKLLKTGHRLLIFNQMTQVIDIMECFFKLRKIKYLRLDGTTDNQERTARVHEFNKKNTEYDVFVLSTKAGGLGLNLQTADTVILFDSDWNPQNDEQAKDRAHRIGTQKEVRVYRLISHNTVEEDIQESANKKLNMDQVFIQAGLFNSKSTNQDRKRILDQILQRKDKEVDAQGEIWDDEQINRVLARDEEEFKLFQNYDKLRYEREKLEYPNFGKKKNYRLISYEEIPLIYRAQYEQQEQEKKEELGKIRKRRKVNLENIVDEDSEEEREERRERRRRQRLKKRERAGVDK